MKRSTIKTSIALALGLSLTLALLWLLNNGSPVAQAQGADGNSTYYVALSCTGVPSPCYTTVQAAVDAADAPHDVIKVATGAYTAVNSYNGLAQVVYISKTVTIRGGYTAAFTEPPDPEANPTTLNAQGGGRVLFITGDISPTIEGLRISGGDATGLDGNGGGVYIITATATIRDNQVFSNTAYNGGGLYLNESDTTLSGNTVISNTADYGGGLFLRESAATLSGNIVATNIANSSGGGLYLMDESDALLVNNLVADNRVNGLGSGLYIEGSSPRLLHTTIARNGSAGPVLSPSTLLGINSAEGLTTGSGGDGSGIYVDSGTVALTNTILVSHTVGITVTTGNTARMEATLWGSGAWANGTDWGGAGTVTTGTINIRGDPAFVDPGVGDYHIGSISAARDAGMDAGVNRDIDSQFRPMDWGYDIGADEHPGVGLDTIKQPSSVFVNVGQVFTYTIVVTSSGTGNATGVVLTDTLDSWQRATGAASSLGACTIADASWGGAVVCSPGTIVTGTNVVVTLTAQVSTTVTLRQAMTNTVAVVADETTDSAQVTTYAQDCHVRLNDGPTEYTTVQAAVDAASPGDLVKVAGVCVGASERQGIRQQVYVDKSLTIRGGYTTTNWAASDPEANPTTLDALGEGRVLYISGDPSAGLWRARSSRSGQAISPTVEGLRITGGDATGLGGGPYGRDAGGGVYVITATATIRDNQVFNNSANFGGGLYLCQSSGALSGNTVTANTAPGGAGLFLSSSPATISGNTITANNGRGLYLTFSDATISGNTISANSGGGLYLSSSAAMVSDNHVTSNFFDTAGDGGGLYLDESAATISGNTITANTARKGGGLFLANSSDATISGNTVSSNTAGSRGGGLYLFCSAAKTSDNTVTANTADDGGGLYLDESAAEISDNTITVNTADDGGGLYLDESAAMLSGNTVTGNIANDDGGGLCLRSSDATLASNVVADNRANTTGSGLYVGYSSPRLLHTTIARNSGGDGSGVYVTNDGSHYCTVTLTNTILVSHTFGIYVSSGNTATLEATLWGSGAWANDSDWSGDGTVITGTLAYNYWGNPAFVGPDAGDYHITSSSAAVDAGVDAGVDDDMDSDPRPMGHDYDLGADELRIALTVTKQADPDPVQFGSQLTYTLCITNTGDVDLHATVTDTLPTTHVTPTGVLTWATGIITPGDVWTQPVVITVEVGYEGTLTNFVEVTTAEGATGVYTKTVTSFAPQPALTVTKQAEPDPVQAGKQLTYTLRVTNTGNVDLHATVTDTLPAQVTPAGTLTWTTGTIAPDDVWAQQVVVSVEMGYSGTLTNVVQVTTIEGASGVYTETSTSAGDYYIYLPLVLRQFEGLVLKRH